MFENLIAGNWYWVKPKGYNDFIPLQFDGESFDINGEDELYDDDIEGYFSEPILKPILP